MQQAQSESDPASAFETSATLQDAPCGDPSRHIGKWQDGSCQYLQDTCSPGIVDNPGVPKPKPSEPPVDVEGLTRELRRFQLLIHLFAKYANINMAEVARRTGIEYSHLTRLVKPNGRSYTGLSATIVRKVKDGLHISPAFIFDDELAPVRSEADLLNVYSLDEQRAKNWRNSVEERLGELAQHKIETGARMLELEAQLARKDSEILKLKQELSAAQGQRQRVKTRPPR